MDDFIRPSGKNVADWAYRLKKHQFFLTKILNGRGPISVELSIKIAKETNTRPEYWLRKQNEFKLYWYLLDRQAVSKLKRIESKYDLEKPGQILEKEFLKKMEVSSIGFGAYIGLAFSSIRQIVRGKKRINYKIAAKLGCATGLGAKYWIDLQSKQDMVEHLKMRASEMDSKYPSLSKYFKASRGVGEGSISTPWVGKNAQHPGLVLYKNFLTRSGISSLRHWADFFCLGHHQLKQIIKGKLEMPVRLILCVSKAFNTTPEYWLRMQNEYYAIKETRSLNGLIKPMISKNRLSEYMCLRNELVENFLKPLGWELGQFADYIGFERDMLLHVISGRCQISIDLAVRFSEALGNHPMHWLDIQMKLNLQRILNIKTLIQKRD